MEINMESIKSEFDEMRKVSPKDSSKKELVAALSSDIKDLMASGYKLRDILAVLNKNGLELKESTLKNYLSAAKLSQAQAAAEEVTPAPRRRRSSASSSGKTPARAKAKSKAAEKPLTPPLPVDISSKAGAPAVDDGSISMSSDDV